jgi:hypothetical protein
MLTKFEFLQKSCNSFHKKNHGTQKNLRSITVATADQMKELIKLDVQAGQKLCPSCRKQFVLKKSAASERSTLSPDDDPDDAMDTSESVNTSLMAVGVSPVKFQRIGTKGVQSYAKQKISQAQEVISEKISTIGNLDYKLVQPGSSQQCTNCLDYNQLIEEIKQILQVSNNRKEQIQILTLEPASWAIKKTREEFNVSENMVREARQLKAVRGILAAPRNKQGK